MRGGRAGRRAAGSSAAAAVHSARSVCPAKSPVRGTTVMARGPSANSPGPDVRSRCA